MTDHTCPTCGARTGPTTTGPTTEDLLAAAERYGSVRAAARSLGVSAMSIHRRLAADPGLRAAWDEAAHRLSPAGRVTAHLAEHPDARPPEVIAATGLGRSVVYRLMSGVS